MRTSYSQSTSMQSGQVHLGSHNNGKATVSCTCTMHCTPSKHPCGTQHPHLGLAAVRGLRVRGSIIWVASSSSTTSKPCPSSTGSPAEQQVTPTTAALFSFFLRCLSAPCTPAWQVSGNPPVEPKEDCRLDLAGHANRRCPLQLVPALPDIYQAIEVEKAVQHVSHTVAHLRSLFSCPYVTCLPSRLQQYVSAQHVLHQVWVIMNGCCFVSVGFACM